MAGSAVVGALRVTLGLDSAQFTTGMKTAQTGLQKFGSLVKAGMLALGTAILATGGAVAVAMKGIIDEADKMSKLSQAIGVPIDELSRLRYAADLAGVDIDGLAKGLKRLSANMLDATETTTGPGARAFAALGISVKDAAGQMKSAQTMMTELAGRFSRMPDGVEKTALAMRLFGKSGADLIPLLNGGAEGLAEMYAEAEQLGIVLDTETGQAAERFNDNLTRMGVIKDGIVTKITAAMLPALNQLSGAMVVAAKDSAALEIIGAGLGWTLKALATAAVTAGGFFYALARDIGMAATVAAAWARQDFAGAAIALTKGNLERERTLTGIRAINTAIWSPPSGGVDRPPAAEALELVDAASGRAARGANRLAAADRDAAAAARDLAREQEQAAETLRRDGEQTFEQTRTAAERYQTQIESLQRQLMLGAISQDTFARATRNARDALDEAEGMLSKRSGSEFEKEAAENALDLARDHRANLEAATYDGIRGGLEAAADGNLGKYLADRIRSALFDRLAGSLTDILMGKPGQGKSGGTAGIFSAILSSFKLPGFKTGGSFKVGGSGGADSQIAAFKATPGEMVDIRRPGQDAGGAMAVHVIPSPYFDVQVERVAAPMVVQGAATAYSATRSDQANAARRNRQRFV